MSRHTHCPGSRALFQSCNGNRLAADFGVESEAELAFLGTQGGDGRHCPRNEADLFRRVARPASYSPSDHVREFLGYLDAFRQDSVARRYGIAGPATCCGWLNARDLAAFVDGVGSRNLKLVTVHHYSATVCGDRTVTIAQLLNPALMNRFDQQARTWVAAVHSRGLPIAMA